MNRKNCKYLVLIISLLIITFHVSGQDKSVYGKVLASEDNKGMPGVNVTNKRTGYVVATNDKGDFYIRAQKGDSLIVTSVGYNNLGIKWDGVNREPVIFLKRSAFTLDEIVVKDKKPENLYQEIQEFLNNPNDSRVIKRQIMRNMINTNTSLGPGLGISIDALYDMFSKEGKNRRKLADVQFQDAKKFYAELRYNKRVVAQITHMDEENLDEFMTFCKMPEDFILRATDYDLTYRILSCQKEFNTSKIIRRRN